MTRSLCYLLSCIFYLASVAHGDSILLWPDGTPGFSKGFKHKEFVRIDPKRISETSQPFMRVFPADEKKATGHGLLIFPGGGYSILADQHEGDDVARFFASKGITSFVVCYRVTRSNSIQGYRFPGPLLDARQAMRLVRKNASKYNVKAKQVGVLGFSAGGHLAGMMGTCYMDKFEGDLETDINLRPAFTALVYPVVSMIKSNTHFGSRRKIFGQNPTPAQMASASVELRVTKSTPPLFIAHNQLDPVTSQNSLLLSLAATKAKVPCELHVYPASRHGFGMGIKGKDLAVDWPNLLEKFIKRIK